MAGKDPAVYLRMYEICFILALAVALTAFLLAVFLFIRLEILGILRRRSGFLRKKLIRNNLQSSMATGRLADNERQDHDMRDSGGEHEELFQED